MPLGVEEAGLWSAAESTKFRDGQGRIKEQKHLLPKGLPLELVGYRAELFHCDCKGGCGKMAYPILYCELLSLRTRTKLARDSLTIRRGSRTNRGSLKVLSAVTRTCRRSCHDEQMGLRTVRKGKV